MQAHFHNSIGDPEPAKATVEPWLYWQWSGHDVRAYMPHICTGFMAWGTSKMKIHIPLLGTFLVLIQVKHHFTTNLILYLGSIHVKLSLFTVNFLTEKTPISHLHHAYIEVLGKIEVSLKM